MLQEIRRMERKEDEKVMNERGEDGGRMRRNDKRKDEKQKQEAEAKGQERGEGGGG